MRWRSTRSDACKNAVGRRPPAWRITSSVEKKQKTRVTSNRRRTRQHWWWKWKLNSKRTVATTLPARSGYVLDGSLLLVCQVGVCLSLSVQVGVCHFWVSRHTTANICCSHSTMLPLLGHVPLMLQGHWKSSTIPPKYSFSAQIVCTIAEAKATMILRCCCQMTRAQASDVPRSSKSWRRW